MASIQELAKKIAESASALASTNDDSEATRQALSELRAASYELHIAATPPKEWIYTFAHRPTEHGVVKCLLKMGVVSAIPSDSAITYNDLASKVSVDQDVLERMCRYSATFGFLQEKKSGSVEHSSISRLAAKEDYEALLFAVDRHPVAEMSFHEALTTLDGTASEPNATGLSVANRRDDGSLPTFWDLLANDPEWRQGFTSYIQFTASVHSQQGSGGLESAFDWRGVAPGSTVVDIGGGRGYVAMALAESFPELKFIVQDREELVQTMQNGTNGKSKAAVEFQAYDFFQPQPLEAKVFFYRKIFHDWSDKYCKKILAALLPAMRPGARLIINDIVLPEPTDRPDHAANAVRRLDMAMLALFNGKERSLHQWKALVCGADAKLRFDEVVTPPGSNLSVLIFTRE